MRILIRRVLTGCLLGAMVFLCLSTLTKPVTARIYPFPPDPKHSLGLGGFALMLPVFVIAASAAVGLASIVFGLVVTATEPVIRPRGSFVAASAAAGLLATDAKQFDVVLTDLTMPEADGFELRRRIRSKQLSALNF
jgi:hypothetical protein